MRTINVAGSNLFAVAAEQFGDATQWYKIAMVNGLTDPMIFGLTTLQVPSASSGGNAAGGLPPQ